MKTTLAIVLFLILCAGSATAQRPRYAASFLAAHLCFMPSLIRFLAAAEGGIRPLLRFAARLGRRMCPGRGTSGPVQLILCSLCV